MRQLLCEGFTGATPFIIDRSQISTRIVESEGKKYTRMSIPGRLSVCDCLNGNGRTYPKRVWEKNLEDGSTLRDLIKRKSAFGLLEHPSDGLVTLESPIAISLTGVELKEGKDASGKDITEVHGTIEVLETEHGRKLSALIESGYNPMVSSRGFGSLLTLENGVDEVCDDYICEGWDVVFKPSFVQAQLAPQRESTNGNAKEAKEVDKIEETTTTGSMGTTTPADVPTTTISNDDAKGVKGVKGVKAAKKAEVAKSPGKVGESQTPAPAAAESITEKPSMNITETKARIGALKAVDVSKLTPQAYAEGLSEMQQLHTTIATYVAEDAKRSYEGGKFHRELESIEESWSEAQLAPSKKAAKLQEDSMKLMSVIKAVTESGIEYKRQAAESKTALARQKSLTGKVVERGQDWKKLAEKLQAENTVLKTRAEFAYEALDLGAKRYKTDVAALGAEVLKLEHKDAIAANEELATAINEAKVPKDIIAIREKYFGKAKKEACCKDAGSDKCKCASDKSGESCEESKTEEQPKENISEAKKKAQEKPVEESKSEDRETVTGVTVDYSTRDPHNVMESVGIAQRLSGSRS